jgi:hypothetical protein
MGLRPTRRNESQDVTPAKAGVHVREELDSRFRGNDLTCDGVSMGLRLTRRNESQDVTPAKAGAHVRWIPALRQAQGKLCAGMTSPD